MTPNQAEQFALMLSSGMPAIDAAAYFVAQEVSRDPSQLGAAASHFLSLPVVKDAIRRVQGKAWQEMSLEERVKFAVEKNYAEAAYFLYSHNYALLQGADRQKADTCRQVLEARLAGTAGKQSPLEQWMEDVKSGRVVLPTVRPS